MNVRIKLFKKYVKRAQLQAIEYGVDIGIIENFNDICNYNYELIRQKSSKRKIVVFTVFLFVITVFFSYYMNSIFGVRCLIQSNYLVWEATRPVSDCSYCLNVSRPIILRNITRDEFKVSFTYKYYLF